MNIKQYLWVAKINAALSMSSPLLVIFSKFIWKLLEAKKACLQKLLSLILLIQAFQGRMFTKKSGNPRKIQETEVQMIIKERTDLIKMIICFSDAGWCNHHYSNKGAS